jgi:hypothetical protein
MKRINACFAIKLEQATEPHGLAYAFEIQNCLSTATPEFASGSESRQRFLRDINEARSLSVCSSEGEAPRSRLKQNISRAEHQQSRTSAKQNISKAEHQQSRTSAKQNISKAGHQQSRTSAKQDISKASRWMVCTKSPLPQQGHADRCSDRKRSASQTAARQHQRSAVRGRLLL